MHESVEALVGLFLPCVGEVEGDHRRVELSMPQVALDETGVHTSFKQMGGVRMSQGMDGHAGFGHAGSRCGGAEGALDAGSTHGVGSRRTLLVIPPGGRKEPGGVTMGFPVGAQQRERICGQRDITVLGALAAMDMDLEALSVNIGDLKEEGCMEPKAQTIDRGEVDLIVEGCSRLEDTSDFFNTEDSGEMVCGLRAQEREGVPIAFEDVLREEADTAGAEAQRRWGEAIDIFPVQAVVLQCLFRDAVRGFMGELREQADFPDIGFLRPFAFATEVKGRNHLLTQWAHEISPFVRRGVRLRRKTA